MKKLSIITINYNNLKGLSKTYDSIMLQSFKDYEWIVIDGGSTDGSKDFIAKNQTKITWWCSERDGGIYNAQNKGILHADGEYLLFLNSGDTLLNRDTLDNVFSYVKDADVVYGDWIERKKYGFKKKCRYPYEACYYNFAIRPLCHQASFIRTSLLKHTPYDEKYRICADWAKWVELSKRGCSFIHIPVDICFYLRDGISYHAVREKKVEHRRILTEFYHKELSMVLWRQIDKNNKRLRTIRLLVWVSSILCAISVILIVVIMKITDVI